MGGGGGGWPRLRRVCKEGGVEGFLKGSERPEAGCLGEYPYNHYYRVGGPLKV